MLPLRPTISPTLIVMNADGANKRQQQQGEAQTEIHDVKKGEQNLNHRSLNSQRRVRFFDFVHFSVEVQFKTNNLLFFFFLNISSFQFCKYLHVESDSNPRTPCYKKHFLERLWKILYILQSLYRSSKVKPVQCSQSWHVPVIYTWKVNSLTDPQLSTIPSRLSDFQLLFLQDETIPARSLPEYGKVSPSLPFPFLINQPLFFSYIFAVLTGKCNQARLRRWGGALTHAQVFTVILLQLSAFVILDQHVSDFFWYWLSIKRQTLLALLFATN